MAGFPLDLASRLVARAWLSEKPLAQLTGVAHAFRAEVHHGQFAPLARFHKRRTYEVVREGQSTPRKCSGGVRNVAYHGLTIEIATDRTPGEEGHETGAGLDQVVPRLHATKKRKRATPFDFRGVAALAHASAAVALLQGQHPRVRVCGIGALSGLHTVNLGDCMFGGDPSPLRNVHTLVLSFSDVDDVSSLGDVHTLDLSFTKVTDVSALGRVHTLRLAHTHVSDVSGLGANYELDLTNTFVKDVSSLARVHVLRLSFTQVEDASALGKVWELSLSNTSVRDASRLGTVGRLSLEWTRVTDVSALGKVRELNLAHTDVRDISAVKSVPTLNLDYTRFTPNSTRPYLGPYF